MSIIGSSIGGLVLNITSSYIYDLLKSFKNKNTSMVAIQNLISKYNNEFSDTDLDCGSFNKFLNLSQTKLYFKQYIRYSSFKRYRISRTFEFSLDRDKFVKGISSSAVQFVRQEAGKQLDSTKVERYFSFLLEVVENIIIDDFPQQFIAIPYFISKALGELEERILEKYSFNMEQKAVDYKDASMKYINILKENEYFTKVDIYLIGKNLDFYSFYVFPKMQIECEQEMENVFSKSENKPIGWKDIFSISNIVSVVGGAGFGKTLFLKNMVNKFFELNVFHSEELVPIYCNLKDFVEFSRGHLQYSIEDFLLDCMSHFTGLDTTLICKDFLKYLLETGRCLILLDALDEVERSEREILCKKIIGFFRVTNRNNKICITSRDRGFIPNTPVVYRVLPVEKNDIVIYLNKMISLNVRNLTNKDIITFADQCKPLLEIGFLTSFLILSLLLGVFDTENELPKNKIDLYDKCTKYIARDRENSKGVKFNFYLMQGILDNDDSFGELAFLCRRNNKEISRTEIENSFKAVYNKLYIDENKLLNAIHEFLRFCSERTELFVLGSRDEHYKFYHRSFFEYYYVKYLIKKYIITQTCYDSLLDELLLFDYDSEVFELISAILKRDYYSAHYIGFLEYLLNVLKKSELTDTFKKIYFIYLIALSISRDEYFIIELYNLCLKKKKTFMECIFPLKVELLTKNIMKVKSDESLFKDAYRYWKEYLIANFCYLRSRDYAKMVDMRSISEWAMPDFFESLINEYKSKVKTLISNISLQDFIDINERFEIRFQNSDGVAITQFVMEKIYHKIKR